MSSTSAIASHSRSLATSVSPPNATTDCGSGMSTTRRTGFAIGGITSGSNSAFAGSPAEQPVEQRPEFRRE